MIWWFACNISDFGVSEYSTTDTFNSNIGKYYIAEKKFNQYMFFLFLTLASMNKPTKQIYF
jgi:hypothetical protein